MVNARWRAPKTARDVYRGYMPQGLPQHRPRQQFKPWWKVVGKPRVTMYPKTPIEGYTDKPQYPRLYDGSYMNKKRQYRLDWYDKVKDMPTVSQKIHAITSLAEHRMATISNHLKPYNSLPVIQYMTQTHIESADLPESYKLKNEAFAPNSGPDSNRNQNDRLFDRTKEIILNQLALEKHEVLRSTDGRFVSKRASVDLPSSYFSDSAIHNLVSSLRRSLSLDLNPQLLNYQVDWSPAIQSWWYHSGFPPPRDNPTYRFRKDDDGNINTMIRLVGGSAVHFRDDALLSPIVPQDDPRVSDLSLIPKMSIPLPRYGAIYNFKWPTTLAGFWHDDNPEKPRYDCPHTAFLSMDCLNNRCVNYKPSVFPDDQEEEECLQGQAILTAFGWLNGLSLYHGFTPYHELTYPFTCQIVQTDGQRWMFSIFQMNGHTFHRDLGGPSRNNILWSTGMMKLYSDYVDGQFKDVNDDVIRHILSFMSTQTSLDFTSQLKLRPYVGEDDRSEEEKQEQSVAIKKHYAQVNNMWLRHQWRVPLYEHIFFRSKVNRFRIKHMKPVFHVPHPQRPPEFD